MAQAGALARFGRQQAAEHADERGLAAPVRPEEPADLPAANLQVDVIDGVVAKALRDAGDVDGKLSPWSVPTGHRPAGRGAGCAAVAGINRLDHEYELGSVVLL